MYKNLAFTSQEFNIFSFSGCCVFVADTDIKATASNVGKDPSVIDILSQILVDILIELDIKMKKAFF